MTKTQTSVIALGLLAATVFGANSALAFGGEGHKGPRGDREGLVPQEMREEWRAEKKAEFENLSDEERAELKEQRKADRQERRETKKTEFASFVGLSTDELKEAKENGSTISTILSDQGVTQLEAEEFLTDRGNTKVDTITLKHELSAEDEQTLRDRISTIVDNILARWFPVT